jgi:cellulose synthase/poly-beta-1,6-N-acetylglucosamine synthase-like glycosyltransferase
MTLTLIPSWLRPKTCTRTSTLLNLLLLLLILIFMKISIACISPSSSSRNFISHFWNFKLLVFLSTAENKPSNISILPVFLPSLMVSVIHPMSNTNNFIALVWIYKTKISTHVYFVNYTSSLETLKLLVVFLQTK